MNSPTNVHKKLDKSIKNMAHSTIPQTFTMNGNNPNKINKALFTMVNGKMVKNVVKENKSGLMAPFIKASFKMI